MSSVTKVLRLTRSSIISSRSFAVRSGNEFKEREEAFESQYVKQKERDDLKKFEQKQKQEKEKEKEKETKKAAESAASANNARIKEIEAQISKLQKELATLKK